MNPDQGARVYPEGGATALLLYRRVHDRYLVVHYRSGALAAGLAPFDAILDMVPVRSCVLNVGSLPLGDTLSETVDAWRVKALRALRA